jgi:ATP-binding cassette subfamily G (WHITE) protein 2 (PDR)
VLTDDDEATTFGGLIAVYFRKIFDKVTVLYEGRQIYFGPKDSAKQYFTDMGYHCPDRQTTADFLTSLTNPEERIVEPGFENKVPRTPDEFAAAWKNSRERATFERDCFLRGGVSHRRPPT